MTNPGQPPLDEPIAEPTRAPASADSDYRGAAAKALWDACLADARNDATRRVRDRADLKARHFDAGGEEGHYIVYDRSTDSWTPRPYEGEGGLPAWVPRPVTNLFSDKIDGIASLLDQSNPALEFRGRSDDDDDAAAAEVAEDALPVARDEIGWDMLRSRLNRTVALTNRAAVVYYYDNDPRHGLKDVQKEHCLECSALLSPADIDDNEGRCPHCDGEAFELAFDPRTNLPIGEPYPIGKLCAEELSSFEFSLPSSAKLPDADRAPWFLAHNRIPLADVHRMWPESRGKVHDDGGASQSPLQLHYADQMAALVAPPSDRRTMLGAAKPVNAPVVYRLWHDPIDTEIGGVRVSFPEGYYGVMVNDEIVDAGPLPFVDVEERPFKNVLVRVFRQATGTQYGRPPADDLIPLQETFNRIDLLIQLALMTSAMPTKYVPTTVVLEDEPTGMPGETVRYKSFDGQRPFETQGSNPPSGLYAYLEQVEARFDTLSKLNAVLQGQRPDGGQPTLGEVLTLQERGLSAFQAPITALVNFEKREAKMLLEIARQTFWSPRFRQVEGENGEWQVKQFWGADLAGGVDIHCDPVSAWPKSLLGEQLKLNQMVELGVLQPGQDPELSLKLLSRAGLAALKPSLDVHQKSVLRDLDRWRAGHVQPPAPHWDLHLHRAYKALFLNTEEAEQLREVNPALHQQMEQHVALLTQMVAPPPTAAVGGAPSPGGQEDPLAALLDAGVIQPAGARGDQLGDLVGAGVLQPAGAADAMASAGAPTIDDMTAARLMTPAPSVEAGS